MRSRAAYKLVELDAKFRLLRSGDTVIDLGAAPGGWSEVAVRKTGVRGRVVAVDIAVFDKLHKVEALVLDVDTPEAPAVLCTAVPEGADIVLSDMAPPATGHRATDTLRAEHLAGVAMDTAAVVLKPGGTFVVKVMRGGAEASLFQSLRKLFGSVEYAKPAASRKDSAELYMVAKRFRSPPAAPVPPVGHPTNDTGGVA